MKKLLLPLVSFLIVCASSSRVNAGNADVIFLNGNIYTVNERQPKAEALAAKGDRIIFVGSNSDAQKQKGDATRVVDLHGQTVVPGLTDSHYHILGVGERELGLNLEGTASLEDLLAKVKARVAQTERGKWVTGRGWIETFWKPPVFPTRADLDKVAPDNPVFLGRADGHGAVVNSAAMKIAGINKETANPFGGEILKDKQTGEPLEVHGEAVVDAPVVLRVAAVVPHVAVELRVQRDVAALRITQQHVRQRVAAVGAGEGVRPGRRAVVERRGANDTVVAAHLRVVRAS